MSREHCGDIFRLDDIKIESRYPYLTAQDGQDSIVGAAGELNRYGSSHVGITELAYPGGASTGF